jgi:predicted metal-dependent hydrolase
MQLSLPLSSWSPDPTQAPPALDTPVPGTVARDTLAPGTRAALGTEASGTAPPGTVAPGTAARGTRAPGTPAPVAAPDNEPPGTLAPGTLEFVRHPRARRYVIRVRDDGTARVTIPRGGSKREARAFAEQQQHWIARQRARLARDAARPRPTMDADAVRRLRDRARRELPARLLELAASHGLHVSRISIRNQRWRWGSCSRSGHICLNWRLVVMPDTVRDYVMIHELMHLRRMDHSRRFWKLVAAACPNYESARRWLREFGRMHDDARS